MSITKVIIRYPITEIMRKKTSSKNANDEQIATIDKIMKFFYTFFKKTEQPNLKNIDANNKFRTLT